MFVSTSEESEILRSRLQISTRNTLEGTSRLYELSWDMDDNNARDLQLRHQSQVTVLGAYEWAAVFIRKNGYNAKPHAAEELNHTPRFEN